MARKNIQTVKKEGHFSVEDDILAEQSIRLRPDEEELQSVCPKCKIPLKKSKVKREGETLTQTFRCRNKYCNYMKTISITI